MSESEQVMKSIGKDSVKKELELNNTLINDHPFCVVKMLNAES